MKGDEAGVSPVIATILLVAIVVVASATVAYLANGFRDGNSEPAPHLAMVTDNSASTGAQWKLSFQSALPPRPVDQFVFVLRTPDNGTLVAKPALQVTADTMEFYWQLGPSAGTGVHNDNQTAVGAAGLGGFHLRFEDVQGDGRVGGGDRLYWWYDGDGDQAHQSRADDTWPPGTYTFEVKHQLTDRYVAYETRNF